MALPPFVAPLAFGTILGLTVGTAASQKEPPTLVPPGAVTELGRSLMAAGIVVALALVGVAVVRAAR